MNLDILGFGRLADLEQMVAFGFEIQLAEFQLFRQIIALHLQVSTLFSQGGNYNTLIGLLLFQRFDFLFVVFNLRVFLGIYSIKLILQLDHV